MLGIDLILRAGLLLSFFAVFLQISVFLQTLLPEKFQIAPVCETIALAVSQQIKSSHLHHHSSNNVSSSEEQHAEHLKIELNASEHNHHDPEHQCQYCTVYGNVVLPLDHDIKEVFSQIKVQLIWLQQQFEHIYFALQRLFLIPQGRAPPLLS